MLLMYITSYKGLLYAVIFNEMSVLTNSRLLNRMLTACRDYRGGR
jgi:hypothetical protein